MNQGFKVGRIILAIDLGLECALIGGVLVCVNGVAHLPQVAAQFALRLALVGEAGDGECGAGKDRQNRNGDDQFDHRESPLRRMDPAGPGISRWGELLHDAAST